MSTWFRFALPCLVLLSACSQEDDGKDPQPDTSNSQLAVAGNYPNGMIAFGEFLFVLVNEAEQAATDLNGDNDSADNVVHRINTATGARLNLGRSGTHNFATDGNTVAWVIAEKDEGTVLNGDGDQSDHFLAVFDPTKAVGNGNPRIFNTPIDPTLPIIGDDGFYAFAQLEIFSGADLTGDGDALDTVIGVLDFAGSTIYQTGIAANPDAIAYQMANGVLAFTGSEEASNLTDFNGDLDTSDITLFAHRLGSGVNISIPHAVDPLGFAIVGTAADPFLAYAIDEANESLSLSYNTNGLAPDFDVTDMICAVFDFGANAETIPGNGVAVQPLRLFGSGTRLVLSAPEEENGLLESDLNSDGDSNDVVPFWIDLADPVELNPVGIAHDPDEASFFPFVCDEYMIILADEASQSGTNFNQSLGDSDAEDTVLHFVDMRTPGATTALNLGLAATQMVCPAENDPSWIMAVAPETDNGDNDLNSDGDSVDEVLAYFPISPNGQIDTTLRIAPGGGSSNSAVTNCANTVAVFNFSLEGTGLLFQDVNIDLDVEDVVATVQVIDKATDIWGEERYVGTVSSVAASEEEEEEEGEEEGATGVSEFPFPVNERTLAFPALESSMGTGIDYNGDGDTHDSVLFHVQVACD